jgi:hypothetical protein
LEIGAIDAVGIDANAHVTFVATPVMSVADKRARPWRRRVGS